MRLLFVSLCCLAPLALAAPLPPAYVASLARIHDSVSRARQTEQICRNLYPALARSNEAALAGWRRSHHVLLSEYTTRYHGYLRTLAGNNAQLSARYLRIMEDKYRQALTVRAATLRHMPKAQSRTLCQNYPAQLASSLNPETSLRLDFQRVRLLRPLPLSQSPTGLP